MKTSFQVLTWINKGYGHSHENANTVIVIDVGLRSEQNSVKHRYCTLLVC